jgi:hypothetical protein
MLTALAAAIRAFGRRRRSVSLRRAPDSLQRARLIKVNAQAEATASGYGID